MKKPLVFTILDGWGIGEKWEYNPIHLAKTPIMDELLAKYPNSVLGASGPPVGLPQNQVGSSEVGHLIIGAGRNVLLPQNMMLNAIESGEIFDNAAYVSAFEHVKKTNGNVHLFGLLSDKGIHSYDATCHKLIDLAKKHGLEDRVYIHVVTDGRDVLPESALEFIEACDAHKKELGIKRPLMATVIGRFYAMDRDQRWDRTEKAYQAMVYGRGAFEAVTAQQAVKDAYKRGETDEFIQPTVITGDDGDARAKINNGDSLICFNYRSDRMVQISESFLEDHFEGFPREGGKPKVHFVATNEYYENMNAHIAYRRPEVKNSFGEVLAQNNLRQFRITETEKWAHLTYFFNGISEQVFKGEERNLIPSDKIATYDAAPIMQAQKISRRVIEVLNEDEYDVILINFANPDMVGHTGVSEAIIEAVEIVDQSLGEIKDAVLKKGGVLVATADHGNAELNFDLASGQPHTAHTMSDVPFVLVSNEDHSLRNIQLRGSGSLQDIAPTLLDVLGIEKSPEMTGESLIQ